MITKATARPRPPRQQHAARTADATKLQRARMYLCRSIGWWLLFAVSALYGTFALTLGIAEVLSWVGAVAAVKPRAVPVVFAIHAVAGGVALITGALQFNQQLLARHRKIHRTVGRVYVRAVWTSSLGGIWIALFFDVSAAAKTTFTIAAVLWFTATAVALQSITRGQIQQHREWMIRSFSLSLFFVTFELWRTTLELSGLPHFIAYPLGLFLGWFVNLAIAEQRIRSARSATPGARGPVVPTPLRF